MSFGITAKLFIALLLTNVITALVVGLGVRATFDSGFERYIEEREQQRLARLTEVFANAYRQFGGWDFLRGNDDMWVQLNHIVRPDFGPGRDEPPRNERPQKGAGPPPPRSGPPQGRDGHPRPPRGLVLDAAGNVVVGDANPNQELARRPITVDGQGVGWLASPLKHNVFDIVDRRFQQTQLQAGWLIALGSLALSALVAWFVARQLIAPVKRIASATRELADGNYATRVAPGPRDELGRLVDDFNRLGNALEKNEALRRNFMADVSHELRTPLGILRGELEALQDGVRPVTPEALQSLQVEVARLAALVDEIHQLSLADAGGASYHLEELDLAALTREVLATASGTFEQRELAVEARGLEATLAVRADPQRLTQVFMNLVENSRRYTHAGGRVRVSACRDARDAVLTWEDSEPGVAAEVLPRIFERFFRGEASRNRASGGSGLGLAICRSIVEAHGGSITASASSLGGLAIEIRLPLSKGKTA